LIDLAAEVKKIGDRQALLYAGMIETYSKQKQPGLFRSYKYRYTKSKI